MADRSAIEWTDATWNPIRTRTWLTHHPALRQERIGWHCEHVSPGCENCYAEGFNKRLGTGLPFKPGHRKDIDIFIDEKMLTLPLSWKRPRMIFVCSMTDLFADFVRDEWIDRMFAVIALCPQHLFQVLTKRVERMRAYVAERHSRNEVELAAERIKPSKGFPVSPKWCFDWPLPNVWLGVSAEDQANADARIPDLLATPAAVRFVSLEPLLGAIDLQHFLWRGASPSEMPGYALNDAPGADYIAPRGLLHWAIVGGESGQKARPMSIQWVRELRDQCKAADVPFFFKQFGEWAPAGSHRSGDPGRFAFGDYEHDRSMSMQVDGYPRQFTKFGARSTMQRVGKRAAGRLLDGVEHNGMPA